MPNLCLRCGFDNPVSSRFCGNCGNLIDHRAANLAQGSEQSRQYDGKAGVDMADRSPQPIFPGTGQRRKVTVLFADLSDSTQLSEKIDSEDLYEIIQQFIKMLANAVYKYGGTVDKFTGDGLMALFGAPVAYENNAERAIHAAREMQSGLTDLNMMVIERYDLELKMHVGLNSGTVIIGRVGSDMKMDYTAIGETVNLAQRLDAIAGPGNILVSENVHRQTRKLFDFDERTGLRLKGIAHPVTGYQLLGIKTQSSSTRGLDELRAAMVGRDAELQQLLNSVQSLVEGNSGSFILIRGEAGIGKTRLVTELTSKVTDKFVSIIHGRSLTYRRSVAYWVFQESLRQHIGVTSDTPERQVSAKLSKQVMGVLGMQAEDVLPYLEYMLSLQPSDPSTPERLSFLSANQLRQQIFIAVRNWLVAEAQYCPIMLVLDDLHWADDASLDLLLFLLDAVQTNPIFICGISRPFDNGILVQVEERARNRLANQYIDIQLKSLKPSQSEQLFCQLLTFPDLPESLRDEIIERADGVPFYLEEILRMLIDDEVIFYEDERWQLHPKADISKPRVPDNLQALILARFDHLEPAFSRVLQVASVIGREFSLPILSAVLPQDVETIQKMLAQLVDKAFIKRSSTGSISDFSFRHVLTSDAIYNTMLRRDVGELHGQIAVAIENLYPDRLNENIYLLAHHYSRSPKVEKSLYFFILAGEKASRDYLTGQARAYYEQARDILCQNPHEADQALQVYTGLGDVLVYVGEYENAREDYAKALALIDFNDASQLQPFVALRRKISTTFERQGDFDCALEHLNAAQKIIQDTNVSLPVEVAKNLSDIGWINFRRGALDQAEKQLTKALALVETTTQYDVIASIYNRLGGIFYQNDELEQSGYYVRKSLVLREEIGDYGAVARSYNNLGLLAWKRGNWDDALDDFSRSMALNQNLGDVEAMIFLHNNIGLLHTDKGNLDIALEHLSESLARSQQIGHTTLEGETYLHYSRYWLAAEEWEKSLFYSQRALEIFDEIGSQERLVDLNASIGEAWLGLREIERAYQAGLKALGILEDHFNPNSPSLGRARCLRLMGNIHRLKSNYPAAMDNINRSIEQFTFLLNQLELGRTYCDMVTLERDMGNLAKARIHAREAKFVFRKLGAKMDEKKVMALTESLR